jgi:hypothetical protein
MKNEYVLGKCSLLEQIVSRGNPREIEILAKFNVRIIEFTFSPVIGERKEV